MDRGYIYYIDEHCDICNHVGAYEINGDFLCSECLFATIDEDLENEQEND